MRRDSTCCVVRRKPTAGVFASASWRASGKADALYARGFLGRIKAAYDRDPTSTVCSWTASFRDELAARQTGFRSVVSLAAQAGLPVLGLSASLGYYDMTRRARLPANLTQAQRDYFGAHTYRRLDRDWRLPYGLEQLVMSRAKPPARGNAGGSDGAAGGRGNLRRLGRPHQAQAFSRHLQPGAIAHASRATSRLWAWRGARFRRSWTT